MEPEMVCEVCGKDPATYHICIGNTGESHDLCEVCYERSATPEQKAFDHEFSALIRNGKCSYCGAPAAGGSGGSSWLAGIPGCEKIAMPLLWCEECRKDLVEFAESSGMSKFFDEVYPFADEAEIEKRSKQLEAFKAAERKFIAEKIARRRN